MNATIGNAIQNAIQRGSPLYECGILEGLADAAASQHDWNKSQELLLMALEKRRGALGEAEPGVGLILDKLGVSYLRAKVFDKAMNCFQESEQILQKAYYAGHACLAPVLENEVDCLNEQEKYSEAEPIMKRALDINEKTLAGDHRVVLESLRKLALIYRHLARPAEAITLLNKALKPLEPSPLGPTEEFRYELALNYIDENKSDQATDQLMQAIGGFKQRLNFARLEDCFRTLSQVLLKAGKKSEAEAAQLSATRYGLMTDHCQSSDSLYPATFLR
jgi:tetratricopeptide (TPR) repeat protein